MKIGIDIDGVLVEPIGIILDIYNKRYHKNKKYEDIFRYNLWECLDITKEESYLLVDEYFNSERYWETPLIEGSFEALKKLSPEHGLTLITSRPLKVKKITEDFLNMKFNGIPANIFYSSGYHPDNGKSKKDICKDLKLNLIIEDHASFAVECSENIEVFLFDRPWNRNFNEKNYQNIKRFSSWNHILKSINGKNGARDKNLF